MTTRTKERQHPSPS